MPYDTILSQSYFRIIKGRVNNRKRKGTNKGTFRAIEFRILIKFGRHTPMDSKNL